MRGAYYHPEGDVADKKEMVGKNGRVCDYLKNLDLLDCKYNQDL
jgi:hypothetical protein